MGVDINSHHRGDVPARRPPRRRGRRALRRRSSRTFATTPASSTASRRSPRPCSAASATFAARCSAASLLGLLESYGASCLGGEWKDVFAFTHPRARADVPADGLLGEQAREVARMNDDAGSRRGAHGSRRPRSIMTPQQRLIFGAVARHRSRSSCRRSSRRSCRACMFFPVGDLRAARHRPQRRRRRRRHARPRLHRLLRRRRVHGRDPHDDVQLDAWLAMPVRDRHRDDRRCSARRADAAAARRLPRDRHARLRRDRAHHRAEHQRARRGARHHRHRAPRAVRAATRCPTTTSRLARSRIALLVSVRLNALARRSLVVGDS